MLAVCALTVIPRTKLAAHSQLIKNLTSLPFYSELIEYLFVVARRRDGACDFE
jgi:hypothetical protein